MKRKVILVIAIVTMFLQAAAVFSADVQKGIIRSVDQKTGTVVFSPLTGQEVTLTADKSVDLDKVKAGDKVEVSVENNILKSVKPDHVSWCPKDF